MKITFKDVGQGDSIILEWICKDGTERIGIVDCNLRGKNDNPVVNYLKSKNYTEIAFIILSHPHTDHYSGLLELLEYADSNDIVIHRFGSTIMLSDLKNYWKYFEITPQETDLLIATQKKWAAMINAGKIIRQDTLIDGKTMRIDDDVTLVSLAPSMTDVKKYQHEVKLEPLINIKEASKAANLLSTILKVTYQHYNFLLTSDTEKVSFLTAYEFEKHHFHEISFHVCQIPHHGSRQNYAEDFWSNIANFKIQNAVASAGKGYRHPSLAVLKAFYNSGYEVYCTNIVAGMKEFGEMIFAKQKALNNFSKPAPEYSTSNDRAFIIRDGNVVLEK
jgi:beta-lactamase superfamily II metal-dependent hydrolase